MFVFCQFWDPSVCPFRAAITSLWFYNGSCTRDLYLRFDRIKKKKEIRVSRVISFSIPLCVSSLLLLGSLYLRVFVTYVLRRYFVCSRKVRVRFIIANTKQRRRSLTALSLPRGISCVHLFHARRNIETRKRSFSFFSLFPSQFLFYFFLFRFVVALLLIFLSLFFPILYSLHIYFSFLIFSPWEQRKNVREFS